MVKCVEKEVSVPFRIIKKCIFARSSLFDVFFCFMSGNKISKIEHNCRYYEEDKELKNKSNHRL